MHLNGAKLKVDNFQKYVELYVGPKLGGAPRIFEKCGERWEVCVAASDDGFQQVSFVNSIATSSKEGGTHVKHVTDQVIAKVRETLKKKHKATEKVVKDNQIQSYVKIFVNCLIENPAFSSQTKEKMTLAPGKDCKKFGSSCDLSEKFFKEAVNGCGILEKVLARGMEQHNKTLAKTDGKKKARLTGVAKLDDANDAGGKNGYKCTLIITEGDSAKALAVSGLSVVGRDHYGIFPLRGKLLNVRDAPSTTIANNKEITELKQILGLQQGKDYSDAAALKSLRYGHLMIMTDQDHDGSHIKGLIINFIHCYWPSLLKHTGENAFLREFVTPIVKVKKAQKAQPFFTLKEYNDWTKAVPGGVGGWTIKYYKGLGTSTAAEAKEYFSDLAQHELTFTWEGPQAGACIERAFAKSMVDARKEWLRGYDPDIFVDHSAATLDYTTFIDKELIHFSNADNVRSIPSMVDGLKPGQRKILYACFKRGKSIIKNEIKVAQLAGYVSEHSAYHHGEASLAGTIVGMAQTFVGSNNIALLHPAGQFGTRLLGGKDAASPRYIFTKLPALTRLIFHPHDDALLEYLEDDGQKIEPKWYLPILPMVLVNGAEGIGTGWSSSVPNYNPREIVQNLRRMMDDDAPHPMTPWYRGFNGTITPADARGTYTTYGEVEKSADGKSLHIKELPVKKWTAEYKEGILEPMLAAGEGKAVEKGAEKVELVATDLREHHTDTTVSFTLGLTDEAMAAGEKKGFHKALKLSSTLATSNMTLFDEQSRIAKYDAAEEVLTAFYTLRLGYYGKRKQHLVDELTAAWTKLDNKMRFVNAVVSGALKIANRKKADLVAQLVKDGYVAFEPAAKKKKVDGDASDDDDGADDAADDPKKAASARGYDYLLGLPLWSLTKEKVEQLKAELGAKEAELQALLAKTPKQLWSADLDAFVEGLDAWEAELEEAAKAEAAGIKPGKGKKKAPAKKAAPKKKFDSDDDGEFDSDDFMEADSDSDYDGKKKKKKAPPKKKAAAAKDELPAGPPVDGVRVAPPDAPPVVAAAPKRKGPTAAPKSRPASALGMSAAAEVDSDDEGGSLAARLAAKGAAVSGDGLAGMVGASPLPKPKAKRAKPAAKGKKKNASSDEDSFSDSDGSDDGGDSPVVARAKGPGRAAAAGAAKKYAAAAASDDDSDSASGMDEDSPVKPKAKAAPKPKAAAKPKAAPKKKAVSESDDDSDGGSDGAFDFDGSDSDGGESIFKKKAAPKKAPAKKPPAPSAKAKLASGAAAAAAAEEVKPKAAAKKAPAKKAPPKKKAVSDSDDDDGSDDEVVAPKPTARANARPAAKKKYAESDSEESEEEESAPDDDSGSDYDGSD